MDLNLDLADFVIFGRFRHFRLIFGSSRFRLISADFTISHDFSSYFRHLPLIIFAIFEVEKGLFSDQNFLVFQFKGAF